MMIYKMIDIESLEIVQRVVKCDMIRNKQVPEYWNEVRCTKNTVDMDDCEIGTPLFIKVRSDHPHSCGLIWLLSDAAKPVD